MPERSGSIGSARAWRWFGCVAALCLVGAGLAFQLRGRGLSADAAGELPPVSAPAPTPPPGVAALGRIEPLDGVLRLAGPSSPSINVVRELLVDEGGHVEAGQIVATLDTEPVLAATVRELEAELDFAEREHERKRALRDGLAASEALLDTWATRVAVGKAKLARARAELERARVVAPFAGLVLDVHAHPGERIGPDGILELARVEQMYAIAEVYESDVARVRPGQRAQVRSPAIPRPLGGEVEWVRPKVQKHDVVGTDPAARKDARVIEVKIRLDDSAAAAPFTYLQVEVKIES